MIAALTGILSEKQANSIVIDANGVGYEVTIPLSTFYGLGEIGSVMSIRIYTYVREDAIQLFGFSSSAERSLFLKLIAVSGIGPKLAITMLSGMSAEEIASAVQTENLALITSIPGIGRKTAERLVIELRDKLDDIAEGRTASGGPSELNGSGIAFDDALSALVNLGYQQRAAAKALKKAAQEDTEMNVQKLLRRSLQLLAKN